MVVGFLAASVVCCSFALMFPGWAHRQDVRWLLGIDLLVVALATQLPNLWVAVALTWIAMHPWLIFVLYANTSTPCSPIRESIYQPLFPVLWWTLFYVLATRLLHPGDWVYLAHALVLWSILNVAAALYQESSLPLPSWWKDYRSPRFPHSAGFVGGVYLYAWLTSIGALSAVCLAFFVYHTIPFLLIALILAYCSYRTGTRSPIIAVCATLMLWYSPLTLVGAIPVVLLLATRIGQAHPATPGTLFNGYYVILPWNISNSSERLRGWQSTLPFLVASKGLGVGLGMWDALLPPQPPQEADHLAWRNLHNDWLQSVVELGPIPSICALAILFAGWTTPLTTPGAQYGLLLFTSLAFYGVWYFPMRDHMQAATAALALAFLGGVR